jgi:hypothetical protein
LLPRHDARQALVLTALLLAAFAINHDAQRAV